MRGEGFGMTEVSYLIGGLALGGTFGLIGGWLLGRGRTAPADARLESELRQQLAVREGELASLRSQLAEVNQLRATAEADLRSAQQLLGEQRRVHESAMLE